MDLDLHRLPCEHKEISAIEFTYRGRPFTGASFCHSSNTFQCTWNQNKFRPDCVCESGWRGRRCGRLDYSFFGLSVSDIWDDPGQRAIFLVTIALTLASISAICFLVYKNYLKKRDDKKHSTMIRSSCDMTKGRSVTIGVVPDLATSNGSQVKLHSGGKLT